MRRMLFLACMILVTSAAVRADTVVYSNGFETDTAGWFSATRVGSGTGGISSSSGSSHAQAAIGSDTFTRWGGYNFNFGGGDHRRDFVFNAGFYNDATGPGANTDRFVISASNNSQRANAFAKNPGRDPIAIDTTGWYTFEHRFYDNAGVLAVDMSIFTAADALVKKWTLSDSTDLISMLGGNRYGWFDLNEVSTLAIDNSTLTTLVPPTGPFFQEFRTSIDIYLDVNGGWANDTRFDFSSAINTAGIQAVPLPAAAWMGLTLIGGMGGLKGIKRLRRVA